MAFCAFSTVKNYLEYWQGRELGRIIKHLVEVLGNLSQQQKSNHAFLDATSFSVELLAAGLPVPSSSMRSSQF
jgi:hypothetical protein